jgi:hypothetical protein
VVVDGDVRVLPAGAAVVPEAICEDALAEAPEADELLGIEVNERARTLDIRSDGRQPRLARGAVLAAPGRALARPWRAAVRGAAAIARGLSGALAQLEDRR